MSVHAAFFIAVFSFRLLQVNFANDHLRDQRTTLARLRREPVPIAVAEMHSYPEFQHDYPLIDAYLRSAYNVAGQSSLGDPEGEYRIFVRKDAVQTGVSPRDGLPCFR